MRLTPRERFCFGNVLGSRKATVALLGVIGALCLLLSACHGEDSAPRPAEPADSGAQSPAEPAGPGPQPPVAPDPGAQPPAEAPDPGHQPPAAATGSAPDPSLVWSADMENGTFDDWFYPAKDSGDGKGGGLYNSGAHEAIASTEQAHSGTYSLRARVWSSNDSSSGVRAFRWQEAREHRELYYSAWFFIPTDYRRTSDPATGAFWNLFQFKSRSSSGRNDPLWALYVKRRADGKPYLYAGWGWGGTEIEGPFKTSSLGGRFFEQLVASLPIGRWFKLEAFLRQSKDFDGTLTIWQDETELYDFRGVRTSYPHVAAGQAWGANNEWSVNNYSDGLDPSPATIYIDDAEIRR